MQEPGDDRLIVPENSETLAACIGPADVSMAALLELGSDIALEDVAHVVYRCPYFALNVQRIPGLEITQLKHAATYTGRLENRLPRALENPAVSVFPIARSGRPLGMSTANAAITLASGESWSFETSAIEAASADQVAFPAGALRP